MSRSHYFYFRLPLADLELIVKAHQTDFDLMLGDAFSEDELHQHEMLLDAIAAVYVQPILSELTFEDFYSNEELEEKQRIFFESCKSSLCLDPLPYFESNPFQVSYLKFLLEKFDEVLIDQGGINHLVFKDSYLKTLKKYKNMDSLLISPNVKIIETRINNPVEPIDFLILDVYKELDRIQLLEKKTENLPDKMSKIYKTMQEKNLSAEIVLERSGLIPKDFEDNLEKLKFWLRKIS